MQELKKVKWSRYRPGVAQRVGRGIALLFQDRGTRRAWVVTSTTRPHFTSGKDPVPIVQEAGWAPGSVWKGGKSRPYRDPIPERPACSSVAIPTELPGPQCRKYKTLQFALAAHTLIGSTYALKHRIKCNSATLLKVQHKAARKHWTWRRTGDSTITPTPLKSTTFPQC